MNFKILLIDDNEAFCELVKEKISEMDSKINLDYILDPIKLNDITFDFDMYLIDNNFNGKLMGTEIVEQIKNKHPDAYIYALTGHGNYEFVKKLWKESVKGFIDKGDNGSMNELINKIEHLYNDRSKLVMLKNKIGNINGRP